MAGINMQDMTVEQLEEMIGQAQDLVKSKRLYAREKAMEEARAILDKAGITPQELAKTRPAKKRATPVKKGERYVNPDDPKQVWVSGRGRRPKWLNQLEAAGRMPKPQ